MMTLRKVQQARWGVPHLKISDPISDPHPNPNKSRTRSGGSHPEPSKRTTEGQSTESNAEAGDRAPKVWQRQQAG